MFSQLREYKEKHGHCNLRRTENSQLFWIANQKMAYKKQRLSQDQIDRLEALGFIWNVDQAEWKETFNKLISI